MELLEQIKEATKTGEDEKLMELVKKAMDQGFNTEDVINNGFIAAMAEVGEMFKNDEVFVPEMLVAAHAMEQGLKELEPYLAGKEREYLAKMAIGTVKDDIHDIGKNLVSMMLKGNGVEVIDLGVDVSEEKFVEAVQEQKPQFLGLSALLTTTMPALDTTIEALEKAGLRDQVTVLVGGAPVSEDYAKSVGADSYCENAIEAVDIIKKKVNNS